ncbi:hypothetical protein ACJJTC_013403 [Scirpophaga incertulas]
MDVHFGPNSVEEPNLLYKLQRKIKVFQTSEILPNRGYNLVTSSCKYGIVFVAPPNGTLLAYYLKDLVDKESEARHLIVKLLEIGTHIAVSCDQELLAVTGGQYLSIYRITDFQNQNVAPSLTLKCEVNTSTFVSTLQWNPCIPDSLAISFFDGTLLACQVASSQIKKIPSKCRCLCWSPKGKQFVTGNSDGTLTQYKPDLTPAKTVPAPKLFEGASLEVMAIYWISTFQFAVVYKNASDNSRPALTVVNTPKAGQPSCINYEDICYSMGANRPWNIILSSSSNSMEIATLGSTDGATWTQWYQSDEARPELPLTDKNQENYPVGICIDMCAVHQLSWGENEILPFMPTLLVVSQTGLLTLFNIINLNKQAAQVCTSPHPIVLPAAAMNATISDNAPAAPIVQTTASAAMPQPVIQQQPAQVSPPVKPAPTTISQLGTTETVQPKPVVQSPQPFTLTQVGQKPAEVKPIPQTQATVATVAQNPSTPATPPQPTPQMQEAYAAMKAEQERIKAIKANEKLRSMLVAEYNNFQLELHKFLVKTRQTHIKCQQDIEAFHSYLNTNITDAQELKNNKTLEDLRNDIIQLKLELVRACAVVAEARTHADAKVLQEWSQADPLTMKRVASVKKLAYYVQNQVEQAHKALDYKWNEIASKDTKPFKPGQRMIRPVLDDVYQPLVRQQEILSRQEAVLRMLKNIFKEIDNGPVLKTTSLLRSTPFKNKDPLSKLTKNILNMSIEPQTKPKESMLNAQKLDALRDMLSNHKTIKVKPVSVELRQQLAAMKINHDKNLKERMMQTTSQPIAERVVQTSVSAVIQPVVQQPLVIKQEIPQIIPYIPPPQTTVPAAPVFNFEPKQETKISPLTVLSSTPVVNSIKPIGIPGISNVKKTLFTNEPKQEPVKPIETLESQPTAGLSETKQPLLAAHQPKQTQQQPFAPTSTASANTKSVLKDLLQQKQSQSAALATAIIQNPETLTSKICSPLSFSSTNTTTAATSTVAPVFTTKPIADIGNMFNKFTTQSVFSESKPASTAQKSSETGEPETVSTLSGPLDKPINNVFGNKSTVSLETLNTQSTNPKAQDAMKTEKISQAKVKEEESKENIPQKKHEIKLQEVRDQSNEKKMDAKLLAIQNTTSTTSIISSAPQAADVTPVTKCQNTPETKQFPPITLSSANKPDIIATSISSSLIVSASLSTVSDSQSVFSSTTVPTTQTASIFGTAPIAATTTISSSTDKPSLFGHLTTSSASSIFGAAVASQPKTTQTGSVFGTTSSTTSSIFGTSSTGSIFGTTTTTSSTPLFGSSTVADSESKSSVFPSTTTSTAFSATSTPSSINTTSQSSVFASPTTVSKSIFDSTTTQTSVFGTATTTVTTTNVFGTAASQPSVFGTPSTTQSIFGAASSQSSVFGSTATTAQSIFGSSSTTTQSSIFGSSPSQPSIFGSPTSNQGSIFGAASAQTSVFGTPTSSPQASVFATPTPTTQTSVFGSPTQNTQSSVFGTPPQTTQTSVFGTTPSTTSQSSLFGGAESNLFAAASISTTNSQPQPTTGNIFGSSTGSVFGNANANTNVFGSNTTFGQSNSTTSSIFGGGQQATSQASSIFSGGTGGGFSTPTTSAQPFGSPQPSTFGAGDNKPSVFGTPQQQTGFGGSSVFGSKPAFGQSASFSGSPTSGGFGSFGGFNKSPQSGFGAPAAFGGGATFGGTAFGNTSPNKMFGGSSPGFGSPTQSNATFESLATQNTLTFGNLAQQSGQQPQQAPTFNTSPAFTGWRG